MGDSYLSSLEAVCTNDNGKVEFKCVGLDQ